MKNNDKDIAQLYIKEDTKKALEKATVLKEKLSAFGAEFARQMKQKGEGGTFKWHGKDIALKYAQPSTAKAHVAKTTRSEPVDRLSPAQGAKELEMGKQNMGFGRLIPPERPASKPGIEGGTPMRMPDEVAGSKQKRDTDNAAVRTTGIRGRSQSTGEIDTSRFPAPGSAGSLMGRATEVPTQDSSTKPDKPEVSSALRDRISPENLGSNPENLVNKGKERKSMNESVVMVGDYKYRMI